MENGHQNTIVNKNIVDRTLNVGPFFDETVILLRKKWKTILLEMFLMQPGPLKSILPNF